MTLPGYETYSPPAPPERRRLAKASLALGIAGLVGLLLCFLGVVPALVGLVLGVVSLVRGGAPRGTAIAGVACSALALAVGAVGIFWMLHKAAECADQSRYPDRAARERCVDREFPFARDSDTAAP